MNQQQFHRLQLLVGKDGLDALQKTSVIIFGIGGVGSWAAESLIRSGVALITIVDSDEICITNINRQIQATTKTIGESKVKVLRERLLAINPESEIEISETHYNRDTSAQFDLNKYDYVIDAIDTLSCKMELIINALDADTILFSSLGSARRLDPTRIRVGDIWDTVGCRLGHFVRKRLRKRNTKAKFLCVYSDELRPLQEEPEENDPLPNGSAAHITGMFGFHLCGLVVQDVLKPFKEVRAYS
jgi:tRNA A37 threonylcarbamoyladenosine dehydratase